MHERNDNGHTWPVDADECTCAEPETETQIIPVGQSPDAGAGYRVTYCTNCNGEVEVEEL